MSHSAPMCQVVSTTEFQQSKLIGQGQYGFVVQRNLEPDVVYKLLKSGCQDAKSESDKLLELSELLTAQNPQLPVHIPLSICYSDTASGLTYPDPASNQYVPIKCLFGMEFMPPIDLNRKNMYQGQLIPIHLASLDSRSRHGPNDEGFLGHPSQGYYLSANLENLIKTVNRRYPNIRPKLSKELILKSIGYLCGFLIFVAHYNPQDFQLMLSLYKGKYTIVCFDVAAFVKCPDPKNLPYDKIAVSLANSTYIVSWLGKTADMNIIFDAIEDVAQKNGYDIITVRNLLSEVFRICCTP